MTTALSVEQLRAYIRELDEEYRKTRSAAETLLRSAMLRGEVSTHTSESSDGLSGTSRLRTKMKRIMEEDPTSIWNVKTMLKRLKDDRFDFGNVKDDLSHKVGNILWRMEKSHEIKMIKKGSGGTPNDYCIEGSPGDLILLDKAR